MSSQKESEAYLTLEVDRRVFAEDFEKCSLLQYMIEYVDNDRRFDAFSKSYLLCEESQRIYREMRPREPTTVCIFRDSPLLKPVISDSEGLLQIIDEAIEETCNEIPRDPGEDSWAYLRRQEGVLFSMPKTPEEAALRASLPAQPVQLRPWQEKLRELIRREKAGEPADSLLK